MFDTIFERILNALSFDIAIMDLHSKYATNFAYPFLLRGFVKHMLFSVAVPSILWIFCICIVHLYSNLNLS